MPLNFDHADAEAKHLIGFFFLSFGKKNGEINVLITNNFNFLINFNETKITKYHCSRKMIKDFWKKNRYRKS
jgi:hypothetical protein